MKRSRLSGFLGFALTLAATLLLAGCPTERTAPQSHDNAATRPAPLAAAGGLAALMIRRETAGGPLPLPFHPAARAFFRQGGR